MTKTANAYTPDRGEVTVEITAADFAALPAAFTQIDTIVIDGVVRKFEETQPRTREYSEVFVTAANTPIKTMASKQTSTQWTLIIVDDYTKGDTGEMGTDLVTALEIFEGFNDLGRIISQMTVSPAGGTGGMMETTLTNVDIMSITHPKTDADANAPNEVTIQLVVESFAKAVHA